jgi:hypothetical protein
MQKVVKPAHHSIGAAGGLQQFHVFRLEMVCAVISVSQPLSAKLSWVRRAHLDPDSFPHSGVIRRLHGPRLGPLVDGSD